MAELPLDQAIPRLKTNEDRFDAFVNGNATGGYTSSAGVPVPSVQKFLAAKHAEINSAADGILAQANTAKSDAQTAKSDAQTARADTYTARDLVLASAGKYHGARATPPTVGVDLGDEYLDTSIIPNQRMNYTSSGWRPTAVVAVAGYRHQDWTATAGQTGPFAVTNGFSNGDVYVNGALRQTGVTMTPGSSGSFTFDSGLTGGDRVSFRGFMTTEDGDFYTKGEVDSIAASLGSRLDTAEGVIAGHSSTLTTHASTLTTHTTKVTDLETLTSGLGNNGKRTLTVSTSAPTGGANGDIHYQI